MEAKRYLHTNSIFIKGKLKEIYAYRVPASAIVNVKVTNCQKNVTEDVNAYVNRPILICAKKNTVKITRQVFDNYGKVANSKSQQPYMNSKDADWDSIIPIAGNWDIKHSTEKQEGGCAYPSG